MFDFLNKKINYFFAGALSKEVNEFFYDKDALRLHSYVNEKREIDKRNSLGLKTFVDSGAFTAMTKNIAFDLEAYIDYLNQNEEHFHLYCQFDTIPFGEIDGEESAKRTIDNYFYMRSKLKNKDKLVYCFHCGEDFKHLEKMLSLDEPIKYIALGGIAKKNKKIRYEFLDKAFEVIKNSKNPNVKVHGFGLGSIDIVEKYPFDSVDSTSWIWYGAFGGVFFENKRVPVSNQLKDRKNYYTKMKEEDLALLNKYIEVDNFKIEDLETTPSARHKFNALQIMRFLNKLEEKK